jgi:hypothetical protein
VAGGWADAKKAEREKKAAKVRADYFLLANCCVSAQGSVTSAGLRRQ